MRTLKLYDKWDNRLYNTHISESETVHVSYHKYLTATRFVIVDEDDNIIDEGPVFPVFVITCSK